MRLGFFITIFLDFDFKSNVGKGESCQMCGSTVKKWTKLLCLKVLCVCETQPLIQGERMHLKTAAINIFWS